MSGFPTSPLPVNPTEATFLLCELRIESCPLYDFPAVGVNRTSTEKLPPPAIAFGNAGEITLTDGSLLLICLITSGTFPCFSEGHSYRRLTDAI